MSDENTPTDQEIAGMLVDQGVAHIQKRFNVPDTDEEMMDILLSMREAFAGMAATPAQMFVNVEHPEIVLGLAQREIEYRIAALRAKQTGQIH